MAGKKDQVEEALASIQAKLDALSGLPPDVTEEFAQIRDAAGLPTEED